MKLKILGLVVGTTLLALQPATASAGTDVYVGIGIPAPFVVERRPVYYYEYEPAHAHYYEYHEAPRRYVRRDHEVRYHERHDRGHHRGHYKHKHRH